MRIAVCKEHHGELYFDVSTTAKLEAFCLSLIRGRLSGKNAYYPVEDEDAKPERPVAMTDEQIAALPETDVMRLAAESSLKRWSYSVQEWERSRRESQALKAVVENNDGKRAAMWARRLWEGYDEGNFYFVETCNRYPGDE